MILEIAVGRLREAQEAELQADCGIPSGTFSVLRADDASRIKPASCVYQPEPTAISRLIDLPMVWLFPDHRALSGSQPFPKPPVLAGKSAPGATVLLPTGLRTPAHCHN
jgi:hypothetical protein